QFERVRGSFASSEALGFALILTSVFYMLYVSQAKGTLRFWGYSILLVTAVIIYATNQRSAWIGFGLCVGLLAISKSDMRRPARIVLLLALLGFVVGVGSHFSLWENQTLFSKRPETISYRLANNMTTLAMGMDNPVFGVGFGNFWTTWPKYFRPVEGIPDLTDGNHNTFLGLFSEVGVVGLFPYLLILYYMASIGLRVYRRTTGFEHEFSRAFLLVMLTYFVGANFSDYRSGPFHTTSLF